MRVLVALLLVPLAAATPALEPYEFEARLDADPMLGRTVALSVVIEARAPLDAPLRLEVPAWVEVEDDNEWRAVAGEGERAEHAWRLTPSRAGYWRATLAVDASRAKAFGDPVDPDRTWQPMPGCCLFAWSTEGRGVWSERPEGAVPGEASVGFHPTYRAVDAERAELAVRMSPQDKRYVGQALVFQIPLGNEDIQMAPADGPHTFRHTFPLADGQSATLSPAGAVRVRFEGGEHAGEEVTWSQAVACANLQVERVGDSVSETARWGCEADTQRSRTIPAAPWILVVLLALAARSAYPGDAA